MREKTIRFIHTGDLHLGKSFPYRDESFLNRGYKDRFHCFEKIINTCKKYDVDYLFLVGDIFEQDLFKRSDGIYFFQSLSTLKRTQVLYVLGNHDFKLEEYIRKNAPKNVYVFSSEKLDIWEDEDRKIRFLGQSWNHLSHSLSPQLDSSMFKEGYRHFLLHHGMWKGEDYFSLNIKEEYINKFEYIALGHVHIPEKIRDNVYMVGTPEISNHKDFGSRGILIGEYHGDLKVDFIPTSKRRLYNVEVQIQAEDAFEDILRKIEKNIKSKEDLYSFILKGQPVGKDQLDAIQYFMGQKEVYVLVTDKTNKLESMAEIFEKHADDIVGDFIRQIDTLNLDNKMKEKVAEVGLRALLGGGQND